MPRQIQAIVAALLIIVLAIFVGHAVAAEDYSYLVLLLVLAPLGIAAVISRGYEFFLAFGLLCPFAFPIPFVYQAPFFGLVLGFCCFKLAFSRGMDKTRFSYQAAFNWLTVAFFTWIAIRYCMNPVLPGLAIGRGSSITGFRGYINYGVCFTIVLTLSLFIRSREEVLKLIKWIGMISVFFVAMFIPLTFSKSVAAANTLLRLGMTPMFFDNGWLRFVVLPSFGLLMTVLALLPTLAPKRITWRMVWVVTGFLAIIMGGNRSTLGMAFVAVLGITLVRRQFRAFVGAAFGIVLCLVSFHYIGENAKFANGIGFFRVLALVSDRVARDSAAADTYEWRRVRWELAMVDVRAHPWLGVGYGGLDAVFAVSSYEDWAHNNAEIDVASGSIHNGYIAGARAFGIPFCLLFICLLTNRIVVHWREAVRQRDHDPVQSDLQTFIMANLLSLPIAIYIGADLNLPTIWFYMTLGFIILKLKSAQVTPTALPEFEPEASSSPGKLIRAPIRAW